MTEWIDALVYAVLLVIMWGLLPAGTLRFTRAILEDRNPAWVHAHPDVAARVAPGRGYLWGSYVLGALSVAALAAAQTRVWPAALSAPAFEPEHWMVLSDIHNASTVVWLVYAVGGSALLGRRLSRIPLAERRRASLAPRSLNTFIPTVVRVTVWSIVTLHLATWIAVGLMGAYTGSAVFYWSMTAFQFALAGTLAFILQAMVLRPPHALDRIVGPAYRRTEVWFGFLAQLVPLFNGILRLHETTSGTPSPEGDRAARLALILFMIGGAVVALRHLFRRNAGEPGTFGHATGRRTRLSAGLLMVALLGPITAAAESRPTEPSDEGEEAVAADREPFLR